jgi:hypothetical protein
MVQTTTIAVEKKISGIVMGIYSRSISKPALFWDVTRCRLVVGYQRFGATSFPTLRVPPETSEIEYQPELHHTPEEQRPDCTAMVA